MTTSTASMNISPTAFPTVAGPGLPTATRTSSPPSIAPTPTATATKAPKGTPTPNCRLVASVNPLMVQRGGLETLTVDTRPHVQLIVTFDLLHGGPFGRTARLYRDGNRRGAAVTAVRLDRNGNRYQYTFLSGRDGRMTLKVPVVRTARFGRVLVDTLASHITCASSTHHRLTAEAVYDVKPNSPAPTHLSLRVSLNVPGVALPATIQLRKGVNIEARLNVTTAPGALVVVTGDIIAPHGNDIGPGVMSHPIYRGGRAIASFYDIYQRADRRGRISLRVPLRLSLLAPGRHGLVLLTVRAHDGHRGATDQLKLLVQRQRQQRRIA